MCFFQTFRPLALPAHRLFLLSEFVWQARSLQVFSFLIGVALFAASFQINLTGNHGAPRDCDMRVSTALYGLHACHF